MRSYLRIVPQQTVGSKTTSWAVAKYGGLCNGLDLAWWSCCSSKARREGMELGDKRVILPAFQTCGDPALRQWAFSSGRSCFLYEGNLELRFHGRTSVLSRSQCSFSCTQLLSTTSLCSPARMSCISQGGRGLKDQLCFSSSLYSEPC